MSDSQPPVWGSAPWDEPDLCFGEGDGEDVPAAVARADDAVLSGLSGLSGASGGFPGPPGSAETVVAALRAGPGPGELDGEAAARAVFRLRTLPAARPPAALSGPLPVRGADGGSRRPPGSHRRPSRAPWHGRRRMTAVLAGTAVALAGGIAVTFALSGSAGGPAKAGLVAPLTTHNAAAPSSRPAPFSSPAAKQQAVEGHGERTQVPAPATSPTLSPAQETALCHEYVDPWSSGWKDWKAAVARLSPVAGGRRKIDEYCWNLLGGAAGSPGSGSQQPFQPGSANHYGGHGNGPGGDGQAGPGGPDAR